MHRYDVGPFVFGLCAMQTNCGLLSMIFNQKMVNHAKASMILVVMLDPSMTVRPVKLTLSLTGSHTFFSFSLIMGVGMPPRMKTNEKNV